MQKHILKCYLRWFDAICIHDERGMARSGWFHLLLLCTIFNPYCHSKPQVMARMFFKKDICISLFYISQLTTFLYLTGLPFHSQNLSKFATLRNYSRIEIAKLCFARPDASSLSYFCFSIQTDLVKCLFKISLSHRAFHFVIKYAVFLHFRDCKQS